MTDFSSLAMVIEQAAELLDQGHSQIYVAEQSITQAAGLLEQLGTDATAQTCAEIHAISTDAATVAQRASLMAEDLRQRANRVASGGGFQ